MKKGKNEDKNFFSQKPRKKKQCKIPYRPQFGIFWDHIWQIIIFFSIESACKIAANSNFIRRSFSRKCPIEWLVCFALRVNYQESFFKSLQRSYADCVLYRSKIFQTQENSYVLIENTLLLHELLQLTNISLLRVHIFAYSCYE